MKYLLIIIFLFSCSKEPEWIPIQRTGEYTIYQKIDKYWTDENSFDIESQWVCHKNTLLTKLVSKDGYNKQSFVFLEKNVLLMSEDMLKDLKNKEIEFIIADYEEWKEKRDNIARVKKILRNELFK